MGSVAVAPATNSEAAAQYSLVSPFPERHWPRVWAWVEEFRDRVADDFAPQTIEAFVQQRIEGQLYEMTWGVLRDGELGGLVIVTPLNRHLAMAHVIFKKSFWGHETTLRAIAAVFAEVFAAGFGKISSVAFADNHQILGLVRKMGGGKEGHLSRNTLRRGVAVDQMVLGIRKDDFEAAMREMGGE